MIALVAKNRVQKNWEGNHQVSEENGEPGARSNEESVNMKPAKRRPEDEERLGAIQCTKHKRKRNVHFKNVIL